MLPTFSCWHLVTQEVVFDHLRQHIWDNLRPRVMVDLGCHAGHGTYKNMSDALIWMHYFNATGGSVHGIDIVDDFAQDLQIRMDSHSLYKSISVEKKTHSFAVGKNKRVFPIQLL